MPDMTADSPLGCFGKTFKRFYKVPSGALFSVCSLLGQNFYGDAGLRQIPEEHSDDFLFHILHLSATHNQDRR